MIRIIIESQNSLALPGEELQALVEDLRQRLPEADVTIDECEITCYGVTWWEVVRIWIAEPAVIGASTAIVTAALNAGRTWARDRFGKEPGRPKYIGIYGPDGIVIKSVLIPNESMDEEEQTENDRALDPRPRPPASFP